MFRDFPKTGYHVVRDVYKRQIGHSIHNKQSNISFKNKKKVRKPQEEWYRVENTDVYKRQVVMITHNDDIARLADRIVRIEDGKIVE